MSAVEQAYGTIVVVGGGCYGGYYLKQLARARDAKALSWERVLIVDRNADCAVATTLADEPHDGVTLVVAEWRDFFRDYLDDAAAHPGRAANDAIVPSPLMPHLMFDWVVERARGHFPQRTVSAQPLSREPAVPWTRRGDDGTQYVSFATWMCPINCIEPRTCPHTRETRDWSMPPAMAAYVTEERARGEPLDGPAIFHCVHRAYGVGMFDTREVLAGDAIVRAAGDRGRARVLVGTVSHCHGAVGIVEIAPIPNAPPIGDIT